MTNKILFLLVATTVLGSIEASKAAMNRMIVKAVAARLIVVNWNLVAWGNSILPVKKAPSNTPELIKMLGFDSATSYLWLHYVQLPESQTDYNFVCETYFDSLDKAKREYCVPYLPNVTMGWDTSPCINQNQEWRGSWGYPYTKTISNNTPENFKKALKMTKEKLQSDPNGHQILDINCWNEWTERSYL